MVAAAHQGNHPVSLEPGGSGSVNHEVQLIVHGIPHSVCASDIGTNRGSMATAAGFTDLDAASSVHRTADRRYKQLHAQ